MPFLFSSSPLLLQVGVRLVWDDIYKGGAGGRRYCMESESSLLVEKGGQLWLMRKRRREWGCHGWYVDVAVEETEGEEDTVEVRLRKGWRSRGRP